MDARRAARKVVRAVKLRSAEVVLGWQAKLLATAKELFPNTLATVMAFANRVLPDAEGDAELPMSRGRALAAMETRRVVDQAGGGGRGRHARARAAVIAGQRSSRLTRPICR